MSAILAAFELVFTWDVLVTLLAAALFGLLVGAIPGLTATMATALLVPLTFFMDPIPAVGAMVTCAAMAIFAGDIPGALLRIPGTPASAAYTDEAYAMTRKGQAEKVLGACVRQIFVYSVLVAAVGVAPTLLGHAGLGYGLVAAALGAGFAWHGYTVLKSGGRDAGMRPEKALFAYSLLYLFAIFAALLADSVLSRLGASW